MNELDCKLAPTDLRGENKTAASTYKKLAVRWLNEALRFFSNSVLIDSFVLRNLPGRKARSR